MKDRFGTIRIGGVGCVCLDANLWGVEDTPEKGQLTIIPKFSLTLGGPAAAGISAIQPLGACTYFFGPLGNDEVGDVILGLLQARGINIDHVTRHSDVTSSGSGVLIFEGGERSFLHSPGSNALLTDNVIEERSLAPLDGFLLAGLGILPALDGEPAARLLEKAKRQKVRTAVDTVHTGRGIGEAVNLLLPSLPLIDMLFVSETEHQQFTGKETPQESLEFLLANGATQVLLKLGPDGVLYGDRNGGRAHWPAFQVTATNTTGCGDAFASSVFFRSLEGAELQQACRYGAAVAALIAQIGNGAKSIESAKQVADFLDRGVARQPDRKLI